MTGGELQDLLITKMVRRHGGTRKKWRDAIGPVRVYSTDTHPHCNWSVDPVRNTAAIELLLDSFRLEHPIVTPD